MTIRRARKSHRITIEQYSKIRDEFYDQWENVDIPLVDKSLIDKSGELAEKYVLKGCDAFQFASAIALGFVVWDPAEGELNY